MEYDLLSTRSCVIREGIGQFALFPRFSEPSCSNAPYPGKGRPQASKPFLRARPLHTTFTIAADSNAIEYRHHDDHQPMCSRRITLSTSPAFPPREIRRPWWSEPSVCVRCSGRRCARPITSSRPSSTAPSAVDRPSCFLRSGARLGGVPAAPRNLRRALPVLSPLPATARTRTHTENQRPNRGPFRQTSPQNHDSNAQEATKTIQKNCPGTIRDAA